MKLKFLGTGAADFWPSLADVDRFRLDPDIRRSTVTLVDETVLLDCGPHLLDELQIHQVDKSKIQHILLSHKHSDHFNPENIRALAAEVGELHLWYNEISSMVMLLRMPIERPRSRFAAASFVTLESRITSPNGTGSSSFWG